MSDPPRMPFAPKGPLQTCYTTVCRLFSTSLIRLARARLAPARTNAHLAARGAARFRGGRFSHWGPPTGSLQYSILNIRLLY